MISQLMVLEEACISLRCCEYFFMTVSRLNIDEDELRLVNTVRRLCHNPISLKKIVVGYLGSLRCHDHKIYCPIICASIGKDIKICRKTFYAELPSILKTEIEDHITRGTGSRRYTRICEYYEKCFWYCHYKSFDEVHFDPNMYSTKLCRCTDSRPK